MGVARTPGLWLRISLDLKAPWICAKVRRAHPYDVGTMAAPSSKLVIHAVLAGKGPIAVTGRAVLRHA